MKRDDLELVIGMLAETHDCKDKRTAFLRGALFGLGYAGVGNRQPNWDLIRAGRDDHDWLEFWTKIEKNYEDAHNEIMLDLIKLIESMLKTG